MKEIWKNMKYCEGKFLISNFGRIESLIHDSTKRRVLLIEKKNNKRGKLFTKTEVNKCVRFLFPTPFSLSTKDILKNIVKENFES